jgi:hypothetical protein
MYDQYAAAKAAKRVERKNQAQLRAGYYHLLADPMGRWLLSSIVSRCKLYDPVNSPEEEGTRRVALMIRNDIETLGLMNRWQEAEREYAEYNQEIMHMLEQTEAKEENE